MRRFTFFIIVIVLLTGCKKASQEQSNDTQMTDDILIDVYQPRNAETDENIGWILTAKVMIETEHRTYGDNVCLSAAFFASNLLTEISSAQYFSDNKQELCLCGMAPSLIHIMQVYGAMPHNSYHTDTIFRFEPLARQLEILSRSFRLHHEGVGNLKKEVIRVIEKQIGPIPRSVYMLGCEYTPLEFAHSMCRDNEYTSLTSFTHHPFGRSIILEMPQNRYYDTFLNVPIDSMTTIANDALLNGHTVCWEGFIDTNQDKVYSFVDGNVTQQSRQLLFDRLKTPLNKSLLLIGLAHNDERERFFIAKDLASDSVLYISENYFKAYTIALTLTTKCIPESAWKPQNDTNPAFILPDSV